MALTKTQICNLALSEIGEKRIQISDYDSDTDSVAVQCRLHYPRAIEELVRLHTWNCCITRDQLSTSAYTEHGWDYYSAIPTGCLRIINVTDIDTTYDSLNGNIKWTLESGKILINYEDPYVTYMTEPTLTNMDPLFTRALYTMLAMKLCVPIKGDSGRNLRNELMNELHSVILPEARRVDGFEEDDVQPLESEWLSATMHGWNNDYPFNQAL